jgi:hypothetical protein
MFCTRSNEQIMAHVPLICHRLAQMHVDVSLNTYLPLFAERKNGSRLINVSDDVSIVDSNRLCRETTMRKNSLFSLARQLSRLFKTAYMAFSRWTDASFAMHGCLICAHVNSRSFDRIVADDSPLEQIKQSIVFERWCRRLSVR